MPSTAIRDIAYHARKGEMVVTFVTGRRYLYADVPATIVAEFRNAPSRGAFFNREIRDHYDYIELESVG